MKSVNFTGTFITFALIITIIGCASSKEGRSMRNTINGKWNLQNITVEGITARVKATVFNEADYNCFTGSEWNFISNNNMGTYTFSSAAQCSPVVRNIRWTIYEPEGEAKRFQFKRLDDKKNPLDNNDGFRLAVTDLTETTMNLSSSIVFEGKPATINYHFIKIK